MRSVRILASVVAVAACGLAVSAGSSRGASGQETFAEAVSRVLGEPEARVLLLGTFHFKDAGLDDYKPQFEVDVLSPERQSEIRQLAESLAAWSPTKVAVEVRPEGQARLQERYAAYRAGAFELPSNEIYQLGFRVAGMLGLDAVHGIDAPARYYEPYVDPDAYAAEHGLEAQVTDDWYERYGELAAVEDREKMDRSLLDTLLLENDPRRVLLGHGVYTVGSLAVGQGEEYPGADARTGWFNRNLRIYARIRRITEVPGDRVLVIIGSGHLPILRHLFAASPEYELVEVAEVLAGR